MCLLVSRALMTCLLDVMELFVLVKGVGDVLAGRWSWVLTCLLVSSGVGDVLLFVEQGVDEFSGVKGVDDVLVGFDVELGVVFLCGALRSCHGASVKCLLWTWVFVSWCQGRR